MIGFGKFGKKRETGIVSMDDQRLVLIDPCCEGFFDKILGFTSDNEDVGEFVKAVSEVKEECVAGKVHAFRKPIYDPSLEGDKVVYEKGKVTAVGHSFNFWKQKAKEMPGIDGYAWKVGTEYQYYAFLVWLINNLVDKGWKIDDAIKAVVLDSKELGHYWNSDNAKHEFETTGSREICGMCDLANTFKILSCTNDEVGGFWLAGGSCDCNSNFCPLADLDHSNNVGRDENFSVGWLVLS